MKPLDVEALAAQVIASIFKVAGGDEPIVAMNINLARPVVGPEGPEHAANPVTMFVVPAVLGKEIRQWLENR